MAEFRIRRWATKTGSIALHMAQPWSGGQRPVAVILHGALRSTSDLTTWADRLIDFADVVLVDLPGHGHSQPISPATVPAMADAILEALTAALPNGQVFLIGESTGGTIALDIGGKADPSWLRAIFAADPPLTTAKLWHVPNNFRTLAARRPDDTFVQAFGRDTFGISQDDVAEIIYYPLIGALRVPTVIATGDVPLLPARAREGLPCLFDQVDQFVVTNLYPDKARICEFPNCGHLLLADAVDPCLGLIRELLDEHLVGNVGSNASTGFVSATVMTPN